MTPTKGDVKHWLKAIGKNRDWLAMECGTEKGTVNNWLSPSGPFPASAMLKIQSLMSQYKTVRPEDEPVQTNRLVLEITEERMRKCERAASEKGVPLRQWLTDCKFVENWEPGNVSNGSCLGTGGCGTKGRTTFLLILFL